MDIIATKQNNIGLKPVYPINKLPKPCPGIIWSMVNIRQEDYSGIMELRWDIRVSDVNIFLFKEKWLKKNIYSQENRN